MPKASPNIPDLGFPKGQLLLVAEVQRHILSIVHQGLGVGTPKVNGRPAGSAQFHPHPPWTQGPCPGSGIPGLLHPHAHLESSPGPGPGLANSSSSRVLLALHQTPPGLITILSCTASPRPYLLHPPFGPTWSPDPTLRLRLSQRRGCNAPRANGCRPGRVRACGPQCGLRAGLLWGRGAPSRERSRRVGRWAPRPWRGRGMKGLGGPEAHWGPDLRAQEHVLRQQR